MRTYERIAGDNEIFIYGNGEIGHLLQRRLEHYGVRKMRFCVSNHVEIRESDDCIHITDVTPNSFVIIAVTDKYRREMIDETEKLGIERYAVVDDKLITTMRRMEDKKLRFQMHLVEHCNLKCRGCYHFSPLAQEEYLDPDEYESDLRRLAYLFNGQADEIMLLGGEPLLHPQIEQFLVIGRECFPKGEIKILTNGILLLQMRDSFYEAVKENDIQLWVTKYPVAFDYDLAEKKAKDKGVEIRFFNSEPVRTLGHQPLDIGGAQNWKCNFYNCYRANECVDLKHGRMYPCIIPAEIKPFSDYFALDIETEDGDSVDIYSVNSAEELLDAMEKPIKFCRYCNRNDIALFGRIKWEQTAFRMSEWTE